MSQPQPLDDFLNTVLGDPSLTESLLDTNKAAMRTAFGDLFKEIEQQVATAMAESEDGSTVASQLNDSSDTDLINYLAKQIEAAVCAIEVLSNRSIDRNRLDLVRQLELQLTAITLSIGDLRQQPLQHTSCLESERSQPLSGNWQHLKQILLKEFDFLNHWLR